MQTNAIKQLVNRFNVLKFQNTDFQNFPLYFPKFPLYNKRTQCVAKEKNKVLQADRKEIIKS